MALVLIAAALAAIPLAAGCGDDDEQAETTLPASLQAPGSEDELAFCIGRLVDPALDDPGRFDLVAECTGIDRKAVEAHPDFVACLSGVAREVPNDRVQERTDRCLALFGDSTPSASASRPLAAALSLPRIE